MINRKNGNTKSATGNPIQSACFSGIYVFFNDPGLFTRIISATVIPLNISKDINLL